jgi:nucleotide-binding universal stress UspA family protein
VNCKVQVGKIGVTSAEEIIKLEEKTNADLVAMSTHGRRGLSKWVFGSVTEKVLRAGKVPVLVVRAKKKT